MPALPSLWTVAESVVVIIDDDRSSLDLLSAYLTGQDVRVVRARDGDEGLSEIHRLTPGGRGT